MTYECLLNLIKEKSTTEYKNFNSRIVKTETEILGCRNPDLRAIARKCADEYENILTFPVNEFYEVDMIKGFVICFAKISLDEKLSLLRDYLPYVENWAVCDSVNSALKVKDNDLEKLWNFALTLTGSEKIFTIRFGLNIFMQYFLDESHIDKILATVDNLKFDEYYLDMGAAWLLSIAFIKCRDKTVEYINGKNNLTKFVRNKALQKVRESFRVSESDKEMAKNMKI